MADNTTLDVGTGGDVIATDDVAGVKYQWVKLADGTADSSTKIASGNGTNTNALRVTVASDSTGTVATTNAGTFAVQDSQVITDNAGFTDGTSKVFPVGFIFDEVAGTALTENDVAAARVTSNRAQVGVIEDGATRARYATVTASNALKVDASGVAVPVTDNSGSLTVDAPVGTPVFVRLSDGSAAITTLPVSITPQTTGGLTTGPASNAKLISAASTNATSVKASAGMVYGWYMSNTSSTVPVYVKLYNKASAPTVGTDVPTHVFMIPAGAAANAEFSQGITFGTGIALAITGAVGDADATAVAANETVVNLFFK